MSVSFGSNVYDDWRLPTVNDIGNDGCNWSYNGTDCGYNVDTSSGEMAHLWYDELGNLSYFDTSGSGPQAGYGLKNSGFFTKLQTNYYWMDTEYAPSTGNAWRFHTNTGSQDSQGKGNQYYAIAVRPGLAVVPEPVSSTLFIVGSALFGLRRFRNKNRK